VTTKNQITGKDVISCTTSTKVTGYSNFLGIRKLYLMCILVCLTTKRAAPII